MRLATGPELIQERDVKEVVEAEDSIEAEETEDVATVEPKKADDVEAVESDADPAGAAVVQTRRPLSVPQRVMLVVLAVIVALSGLAGWWGWHAYQVHQAQVQRSQFLQVARQGALNLTTIDWQHADTDVERILDSATGPFYDDFAERSQSFIDIVRQAQATTTGTIAEAGLESETPDGAQVLVAVNVETVNAAAPEQTPRAWRMRLTVQKVDDQVKVSNVEFVA
ncbi:tetratricopeptide repeat protein [Mycolicibacillus koreensis]|nr:tetratricopeptide repeat protein [Mycolicibacillus koreensis]BBY52784.1 Mce associated membrane protein [Mycolicibacillus koreensis]